MSENNEEREPLHLTPLYILLPMQLGLIAGTGLVGAVLINYVHWAVGTAAVLVIGVGLMITASRFRQPTFTFTGVMTLAFGGLLAWGFAEAAYVVLGDTVRGIPVSQAADYPNAHSFYFTDGRVLHDRRTWITRESKSRTDATKKKTTSHVAPVVGDDWAPGKGVVVWAVTGRDAGLKEWEKDHRAGIRNQDRVGHYAEVIVTASGKPGLSTIENPVLIEWVKDPMVTGSSYALVAAFFSVFFCTIWLVSQVVGRIKARRRGKAG